MLVPFSKVTSLAAWLMPLAGPLKAGRLLVLVEKGLEHKVLLHGLHLCCTEGASNGCSQLKESQSVGTQPKPQQDDGTQLKP